MFKQTQQLTLSNAFAGVWLASLTATPAAPILGPTTSVQLYNNDHLPQPFEDATAYTPAVFPGYQPFTAIFKGPVNAGGLTAGLICSCTFMASITAPFTGDTIYGYWISVGNLLVAAERFDNPVAIAKAGDFLEIDLVIPLGLYQAVQ